MGGHPRSESSYPSHLIRVILSESTSPSHLTRMRVTWALPVEVVVEVAPGLLGGHRPPELVQALRGRGGTKRNVPGGVRAGDRVMGRPNTSRRMYRTRGSLSLLLSLSLLSLSLLLSDSLSLSLSRTPFSLRRMAYGAGARSTADRQDAQGTSQRSGPRRGTRFDHLILALTM